MLFFFLFNPTPFVFLKTFLVTFYVMIFFTYNMRACVRILFPLGEFVVRVSNMFKQKTRKFKINKSAHL